MAKVIEAIYENGVFKPLEKVDLKEGERVKITIRKRKKTSKGLSKILEKYTIKVDEDVLKEFLNERR